MLERKPRRRAHFKRGTSRSVRFRASGLPSARYLSFSPAKSPRCCEGVCWPKNRVRRKKSESARIGLSWPKMLTRQDTSPFGLCLTLRLQWRPARFKSASGHAMSPNCLTGRYAGKLITLVNWVFIWGSTQMLVATIQRFLFVSTVSAAQQKEIASSIGSDLSSSMELRQMATRAQGTFNAAVVATLGRHYPDWFPTEIG